MFAVCKKSYRFSTLLDTLLFLSLLAPPAYMLYRFVRWYLREGILVDENENDDFESTADNCGEPEVNG